MWGVPSFLGILSDIDIELAVAPSKEISESSTDFEDSGMFVDGMVDTLFAAAETEIHSASFAAAVSPAPAAAVTASASHATSPDASPASPVAKLFDDCNQMSEESILVLQPLPGAFTAAGLLE